MGGAFNTAFRAGGVMGFSLCGLALLVLYALCGLYSLVYSNWRTTADAKEMFECVAGFGLGGSSIALFGRVGGGIYTKAADVGADLAGKVVEDIPEDDPRNPATIADNVGDNVGDVAGMGSDLFGSFAEASCAALVVGGACIDPNWAAGADAAWTHLMFPLAISAVGIFVCLVCFFIATHLRPVQKEEDVETVLKTQLAVTTVILTGCIYAIAAAMIGDVDGGVPFTRVGGGIVKVTVLKAWACVCCGLWSGCIIGFVTEYFTSHSYTPVRDVAQSCLTGGAATNIIYGLALGFKSCIIPVALLSIDVFVSFKLADMYGVALAALGMLSNLATCLSIDVYGPVCDNAGGIAEMSELDPAVREITDALDAAGNTTAAVGKGFAIGSACLVGLALFGAFITRIGGVSVDILQPVQFAGLLVGAMLPYAFSAMTMKAVGDAAFEMMDFIVEDYGRGQKLLKEGRWNEYTPDYDGCIKISTDASLKKMVAPGALVLGSPLAAGFLFGPDAVAGLLAGAIVSGVQVAISASNTGGAWDNAKKEVEKARSTFRANVAANQIDLAAIREKLAPLGDAEPTDKEDQAAKWWIDTEKELREKHIAAVVGDTVGDPLKDTSGPAINILIKLSAITSLVFGNYLAHYHIFGNKPAPIQWASQLLAYCNTAGDNPNTVDTVLKNCDQWLAKGYFQWNAALPAKTGVAGPAGETGLPHSVWEAWYKKIEKVA